MKIKHEKGKKKNDATCARHDAWPLEEGGTRIVPKQGGNVTHLPMPTGPTRDQQKQKGGEERGGHPYWDVLGRTRGHRRNTTEKKSRMETRERRNKHVLEEMELIVQEGSERGGSGLAENSRV